MERSLTLNGEANTDHSAKSDLNCVDTRNITSMSYDFPSGKVAKWTVVVVATVFTLMAVVLYSPMINENMTSFDFRTFARQTAIEPESLNLGNYLLAHLPMEVIKLSRTATASATPLLLIDKFLLSCSANVDECATLSRQNQIMFGIYVESVPVLAKMVPSLQSNDCQIELYNEEKYIVATTDQLRIIIAPIERRTNYWHIEGLSNLSIPARALLPFRESELVSFALTEDVRFSVPSNINATIAHLKRSEFLQCNSSLAKSLRSKYPAYYKKEPIIQMSAVADLAYFKDVLMSIGVVPFLFGGTLLGWYRECGIIPYTTDLDMSAFASDYNSKLELTLRRDKRLKLYWILGKPDDSLEYSVYANKVKIDLFFLYQNQIESWVGGMIVYKKEKLRWTYPKLKRLCSVDLAGYLLYVPCNVESFLQADYGPRWYEPFHDSKFVWYESHSNIKHMGKWTAHEWPSVYRTFS